jgi:3-keto-disaccharide hydrolase
MSKHRIAALAALLALVVSVGAMAAEKDGWVKLFDGKTLDGWIQKNGTATYRVEDGAIVGKTTPGSPNSFLCSEKDYGDFELEFEVKLMNNELNSGVQIRSLTKEPKGDEKFGRVNGPQVEIEASGENGAESGYIYGEACGGWMTPEDKLKPRKVFKDGLWNKYRIVAKGARLQTWINGDMVEDLTDEAKFESHPKGFIGLQVHGVGDKGPYEVAWRNIRIKVLDKK